MRTLEEKLTTVLREHLSSILAKSILTLSVSWAGVEIANMRPGDNKRLLRQLLKGVGVYLKDPVKQEACAVELRKILSENYEEPKVNAKELVCEIDAESGIVSTRAIGRDLCREMGFSAAVQIKVATAISELARNIVQYAQKGTVTLSTIEGSRRGIEIVAKDNGPGIKNLEEVFSGSFRSKRGMGIGLMGTKKMMDEFDIQTAPDKGTTVTVRKYLS